MEENLSVIIVTYNRLEWIKKSLEKVLNQSLKFKEIIVVNNASTDGTGEYLNSLEGIKVLNMQTNLGGSGGFYTGMKFFIDNDFDGWVTLMDDDCLLEEKFVEKFLLKVKKDKKNSYIPFVFNIENKKVNRLFSKKLIKIAENLYQKDSFPFNGFIVHKDLIKEIGLPVKEYFIYGDDYEYCYRILRSGGKNNAMANIKLYHPNKTDGIILRKGMKIAKNELIKFTAYYGTRNTILNKKKYGKIMQYSYLRLSLLILYRLFIYTYLNEKELLYACLLGIKDGLRGNMERKI